MDTCTQCGTPMGAHDQFCGRCGSAQVAAPAPSSPTVVFAPPFPPDPYARGVVPAPGPTVPRRSLLVPLIVTAVVAVIAVGVTVGLLAAGRSGSGPGTPGTAVAAPRPVSSTAGVTSAPPSTAAATSAAPADFAAVYGRVQSGIVRIEVLGCGDDSIGTGFLLSPTLIATVSHVVDQPYVIGLSVGDHHTTGQVIGRDASTDLALVRSSSPITGHVFRFADRAPQVGERVATAGFPIGDPITLTQGGVSGLDRTITAAGAPGPQTGLIETDAAINPGNSGGPLLAGDGSVLGLVDAKNTEANGIAYAVPASQAKSAMRSWAASPATEPAANCDTPLGPADASVDVPTIAGLDPAASEGITSTLESYFDGINTGDYGAAYDALSPRLRSGFDATQFARGLTTSYDFDQTVLAAHQVDEDSARVAVGFTSIQASAQGPDGDTCDQWTLVYHMEEYDNGAWLIDRTTPYQGRTHTSCG